MNNNYYILVHDNKYSDERVIKKVLAHDVGRCIEAIRGQGCKCGCWDLEGWQRVKHNVRNGKTQLT